MLFPVCIAFDCIVTFIIPCTHVITHPIVPYPITIPSHCTFTLYPHAVPSHCTITLYLHTVSSHCTFTLYPHTVPSHCILTLHPHTVLSHCTFTLYPRLSTPPYSGTDEGPSGGGGTGLQTRVLSTFLNELDGITSQDLGEEGAFISVLDLLLARFFFFLLFFLFLFLLILLLFLLFLFFLLFFFLLLFLLLFEFLAVE